MRQTADTSVDPVLLQILGGELDSIAKEMAHQLIRSSYSVLIRESEDMGCALLNTRYEEIAESDTRRSTSARWSPTRRG